MSVSDLVLLKVLELYNITHPLRSTIQLRTFRASFPPPPTPTQDTALGGGTFAAPQTSAGPTRVLTTITYSQHLPPVREVPMPLGARDDVTYLFLEDRGVTAAQPAGPGPGEVRDGVAPDPPAQPEKQERKHMMLAVRPATSVMPTLQQLLSPFVLGLSKSARVQASTTAQAAAPTPLSGTPFVLTSLAFPPAMGTTMPPVALSLHVLPGGTAQTIFLEAEWDAPLSGEGAVSGGRRESEAGRKDSAYPVRVDTGFLETDSVAVGVLKEFLDGCVPEAGERRYWIWEREDPEGWVGIEKNKRTAFLLARALRESGFI
ncbi:hypothetical protein A1Q2_04023 [Trichosporon asahii var. asahii CBS 8904]|uniref:Uncharacterized protein n=1 Tax=Trichosporon asahii var. asahii (strain CBS 8904) TaxID=1220162 RepID=K1VQJ8_TRIAC|nr:hypothetical protein A1Q2_04023 [Trichosporon asahii var. asahii CBS 8904]